jgi:hypothetical protein
LDTYGEFKQNPVVASPQVTSDTNGHLEMCLDDEGRIAALLYCGTSLLSLKDPLETPV